MDDVNDRFDILVAMPTQNHAERMKLEGILQYAHEKKGTRWNLELGLTLAAAIRRLRLEKAAEMLVATDLPVAEIADRCGVACVSHFAILMRRAYGSTPLAYRRENRR